MNILRAEWKLLPKLLFVVLVIIVAVTLVVWLSINFFATDYFSYLLESYHVPKKDEVLQMFRDAAHRGLFWGAGLSLVFGTAIGFLLVRRLLRPLYEVIGITGKIAEGDYTSRVRVGSLDEIGLLGTAFNAMTDRLQRVEALRRRSVIDVAHELRAPLTNIRGYLEALATDVLDATPETIKSLQGEALRLSNLADDLMRLSNADAAYSTMVRSEVDLNELLAQSIALFRGPFEARGIAVSTDVPSSLALILVDKEKMTQIFQNLLDNAAHYTPDGGRLHIAAVEKFFGVSLSFCNTGDAMSKEDCVLIFERFYRVDASRARTNGGAGIGLAIVKELVEAHGGRVAAQSGADMNCIVVEVPRPE